MVGRPWHRPCPQPPRVPAELRVDPVPGARDDRADRRRDVADAPTRHGRRDPRSQMQGVNIRRDQLFLRLVLFGDQLFDLHSKQTALDLAPITFQSRSLLLQKNPPE